MAHQLLEALLEQGVEQPILVAEVVVDGGRGVPAALHQLADGHRPLFHEEGLGGIENRPTSLLALLVASLFLGGRAHGSDPGSMAPVTAYRSWNDVQYS